MSTSKVKSTVCITTVDGHLRSKQFGQQHDVIAFLALTAQPQGFALCG
jgi:hypothetical protein